MKKTILALVLIFIINTLAIPVIAIEVQNPTTGSGITVDPNDDQKDNIIIIKENQDAKCSEKIDATIALFKRNFIKESFDLSTLAKEFKARKNTIVSNVFNQKIENNTAKLKELLNKTYDALYSQYGKKLTTYSNEDFNALLDKYMNKPVKPNNTLSFSVLVVVQNKNTGSFISYTPINVKISAAYDKFDTTKIKYSVEIQSLNFLQLNNG